MTGTAATGLLTEVWRKQSVWSQVANRLKRELQRNRDVALILTIIGATLSAGAAAAGLQSPGGKALAGASAVSLGLAGLARAAASKDLVRAWTRARSVSEALKSEVYLYLARVGDYKNNERDGVLDDRSAAIELEASDLLKHAARIQAKERAIPRVNDLPSYMDVRVKGQIEGYYRPRSEELHRKVTFFRRVQAALSAGGVVAGAAAAVVGGDKIALCHDSRR